MKILLADSSNSVQKVVELALVDREDVELTTVGDGNEALRKVEETRPDLLIADIELPAIDGYGLCEKIKTNPQLSAIKVYLLKPSFASYDSERANTIGADGMLEKPFSTPSLLAILETARDAAIEQVDAGGELATKDDVVFELMEGAVSTQAANATGGESSFAQMEKAVLEEGAVVEKQPETYEIEVTEEEYTKASELFVVDETAKTPPEEFEVETPPAEAARREPSTMAFRDDVSFADLEVSDSEGEDQGVEMFVEKSPTPPPAESEESQPPPSETVAGDVPEPAFQGVDTEAQEARDAIIRDDEPPLAIEEEAVELVNADTEKEVVPSAPPAMQEEPDAEPLEEEISEDEMIGAELEDFSEQEVEHDLVTEERKTLGIGEPAISEEPFEEEEVKVEPKPKLEMSDELVEKITEKVLARLSNAGVEVDDEAVSAAAGEELVKEIVSHMSTKVVQDIAWEVVPDLAERMIQAAIDEMEDSSN